MIIETTYSMDIVNNRGHRFTVVLAPEGYWYRGKLSTAGPLVEFYDATHRDNGDRCHLSGNRRHDWSIFGQFVSDYNLRSMLERHNAFGLNLHGGEDAWSIDAHAMLTVRTWLEQMTARIFDQDRAEELLSI